MKPIAQENIVELVKLGHERAAELKASCGAVDVRSLAQLISDLATQLEVQLVRGNALAAENAGLKELIEQHANSVAVCPNCSHEEPSETDDIVALYRSMETPSTDTFLAEVRASAIPEGYVLVPQQIFLDPSDIESICSQCGDGHESGYGDFTDGLLWVGNIQRDDGSIVHGLHISSADYTEEGGVMVCEFSAQLRKGAAL